MGYKLLRQDCHPDSWSVLCVQDLPVHLYCRGELLPESTSLARVTLSALGSTQSDFLEAPCAIVSGRMRRVFDNAGVDNVQWVRAELEVDITKSVYQDYYIMNVVGKLACVDTQASDLESDDDGRVTVLRGFRLDPERTYGLSLFRVAEDPRVIAVSERLQRALGAAGLDGVILQDPGTYDRGLPVFAPRCS